MAVLVRKIEQAKWQKSVENNETATADAISSSLRTIDNTLSVWRIDNVSSVDDVALAIASGLERLATFDVVCIEEDEILKQGHPLQETPGNTPYKDFEDHHRDIAELDFWGLGCVSESIIQCVKYKAVTRFSKAKIKNLLKEGVSSGAVKLEDLKLRIKTELEGNKLKTCSGCDGVGKTLVSH